MKSCPTCNRTYPDDTLAFCLIDGSVLSAPFDPQTKQPYSQRAGGPPPTEIFHAPPSRAETLPSPRPQPTMPSFPQGQGNPPTVPARRSNTPWIAIGAGAFVLLIIAGIAILLVGRTLLNANRSVEQNTSESTSTVSDNSQRQALPESSPTPAKLDVAGRWVGTSDEDAAILVIDSSSNDSYQGTEFISSTRTVKIAVDIQVDSESRRVTINETKLLEGEGLWNLGVNEGTISSDGLKMNGSAKDTKGKTYSWSFTKQISNRKP